jgi:hypothetical protein
MAFFNLHRELFFYLAQTKNQAGACLLKRNILERQSLVHGGVFPIFSCPLLEVICRCALCISLTPRTFRSSASMLFAFWYLTAWLSGKLM